MKQLVPQGSTKQLKHRFALFKNFCYFQAENKLHHYEASYDYIDGINQKLGKFIVYDILNLQPYLQPQDSTL